MARQRKLRLLVTAGPTREPIDSVRYLSNDSSGKMGFAVAEAAAARGMRVTLVHGPVALPRPARVRAIRVVSAAEMHTACANVWPRHDALVMAAAVADYTPVRPARHKRKKSADEFVLRLKPTEDILAALAISRREDQVVVGFALEDRSPRRNAERKLKRKGLDAIVLNRPDAIGADVSAVELLVAGEPWRALPGAAKTRHAAQIVRLVERLWSAQRP